MGNEATANQNWLSKEQIESMFEWKYPDLADVGWGPRLRKRFKYYTPDDHYEALVSQLISERTVWADVGCGRDIFPSNSKLASELSERARFVLGIDPDPNILENQFLSQAVQSPVDTFKADREYDLVTLRMVAEHVEYPSSVVGAISNMLCRGGLAVVYTPHKFAPFSILARMTPIGVHHFFKRLLWSAGRCDERDTFPVKFRMNTRRVLAKEFSAAGMTQVYYDHVDDCRVFQRWYLLNYLELGFRKLINALKIQYPEVCILAVYRKT